jgi:alkanesulfonate monooxygenase
MTEFGWELPTRIDDARGVPGRGDFDLYEQIALAADQSGFDRLVVPFDPEGDESIVLGGHLARITRRIAVDIEIHPGVGSPVYLAKLFATLERATGQRIGVHLRTRAGEAYERTVGEALSGAERERRQREFWEVFAGVWREEAVSHDAAGSAWSFDGDFFQVVAGGLSGVLSGLRLPRLAQQIDQDTVIDAAADVVFARLTAGGDLTRELDRAREAVQGTRGPARLGLTVPVIARADAEEAWDDLEALVRRSGVAEAGSLRLGEHHWAGFGRLGAHEDVGLVGAYRDVADALRALRDAYELTDITLTGADVLGDVYRSAEHLLPAIDSTRVPRGVGS